MLKILFTSSDKWFSKAIMEVTGEPVSHCALEFPNLGIVIHSNFRGLHIQWASTFRKENNIIYEIPFVEENEFEKIDQLMQKHEFVYYDIGAMAFLGVSMWLKAWLGVPLPKSNLWQSTGMHLCTEWVSRYVDGREDSMITPHKLYSRIQNRG